MNQQQFPGRKGAAALLATLAVSATFSLPASAQVTEPTATAGSRLGINLAGPDYWSPELKFIDLMKQAQTPWSTVCNPHSQNEIERELCRDFGSDPYGDPYGSWNTGEQSKLAVDANDYPLRLPAPDDRSVKFRTVSTIVLHESANALRGKYIVLYEGAGKLRYVGPTRIDNESTDGRDVVQLGGDGRFELHIDATDPNNRLRNIRVIPPGGYCSGNLDRFALDAANCVGTYIPLETYAQTHTFHPKFVAEMKGMRHLRFMDSTKTNDPEVDWHGVSHSVQKEWGDRPVVTDRTYTAYGRGLPYGVALTMTQETGTDPWLNIPVYVSDDYVRRLAAFLKANLRKGQTLTIEYGNEAWNWDFRNTRWLHAQGKALFGDLTGDMNEQLQNYYAMRSAQTCKLVKAEFGADATRVRCALNVQAANTWIGETALKCEFAVAKGLMDQPCHKVMDAIAIAPYFGGDIGGKDYLDLKGRAPTQWLGDSDGGLGALFTELKAAALPQAIGWMNSYKQLAAKYQKLLLAYEGGQHLLDAPQNRAGIQKLFADANRDARMGSLYTDYLNAWMLNSTEPMTLFNSISSYSKYGYWGLRETMWQNSTPKWDAARNFLVTTP